MYGAFQIDYPVSGPVAWLGLGLAVSSQSVSRHFLGRMAKNSGPNPRTFPKTIIDISSGGDFWLVKWRLHTYFCLHIFGLLTYDYSLITFHVLIKIYSLVSLPPSVSEGVGFSDYMLTLLLWTPLTGARAAQGL